MPGNVDNLSVRTINRTFKTMVLEVSKQVGDTLSVLAKSKNHLIKKISSRDDYIDYLKASIEEKCFCSDVNSKQDKKTLDYLRAINVITANLEHISDYSESIVSQIPFIEPYEIINRYEYKEFLTETLTGLDNTIEAIKNKDMNQALEICRTEFYLDSLFKKNLAAIIEDLKETGHAKSLVAILFIFNSLENMGEALLNMGEAIISYVLGEKLKIHDFEALEESMVSLNENYRIKDLELKTIWDTKSGCRTTQVKENKDIDKKVIFKEGNTKKIIKEYENIKVWEGLKPGLPPKVFSFQKSNKNASILIEYLDGYTFQQLLIGKDSHYLEKAIEEVKKTVEEIWDETKEDSPVNADYVKQIVMRIEDIVKAHPDIDRPNKSIGTVRLNSLKELVLKASEIEHQLEAPFSVYAHGDFNIDNILYDIETGKIHFLDFYRSARQDYLQDVSVFLVSNFRLPVSLPRTRNRLNKVILDFYSFSRNFAEKKGDKTFDARLCFGLARSLLTSTRFEYDHDFSNEMYLRSIYLLEKLTGFGGRSWKNFVLPIEILLI